MPASWPVFLISFAVGFQMVISGKARCKRQIVAVSNDDEKIIAYGKLKYSAVRLHSEDFFFYFICKF